MYPNYSCMGGSLHGACEVGVQCTGGGGQGWRLKGSKSDTPPRPHTSDKLATSVLIRIVLHSKGWELLLTAVRIIVLSFCNTAKCYSILLFLEVESRYY